MATWKIKYDEGQEFVEGQACAKHVMAVAALLGTDSWDVAKPLSGPTCLAAWVAVLRAGHRHTDPVVELQEVVEMPMGELLDLIEAE